MWAAVSGGMQLTERRQCGLYRTGKIWAHSGLGAECQPDIITMAKPLANGYPIGAVMIRDEVASTMTAGKRWRIRMLGLPMMQGHMAQLSEDHHWPAPSDIMC